MTTLIKNSSVHAIAAGLCACALALLAGSCSEPVGGMGKSPVYLTANGGAQWGMIIDVYKPNIPGGVNDEYFNITIESNYKNPSLASPYADVIIQEYRVNYYRVDGKAVPAPFTMHLMAKVPGGETYNMNTLVLKRGAKLRSPLKDLVFGGGEGTIEFNAIIDFYGEDMMGNKVSVRYVLDFTASDM